MKTEITISDLSKENKGPLQMSDGNNLFLKEYCNITINFPFLLNYGDIFCSERGSYGLVQNCSKMGLAQRESFNIVSDGLTPL